MIEFVLFIFGLKLLFETMFYLSNHIILVIRVVKYINVSSTNSTT